MYNTVHTCQRLFKDNLPILLEFKIYEDVCNNVYSILEAYIYKFMIWKHIYKSVTLYSYKTELFMNYFSFVTVQGHRFVYMLFTLLLLT